MAKIKKTVSTILVVGFFSGIACNEQANQPSPPPTPNPMAAVQPTSIPKWEPDPSLPKPDIKVSVAIVKEPERKKISMKVTATEANGLTVQEVHFILKYRTRDEQKKEWTYPEGKSVRKMIPVIQKGGPTVFATPFVEDYLKQLAWDGQDENWEVEIVKYGQYKKEP